MLSMLSYEVDVTINPLNKIPIYIILYTLLWEQWHIKWLIFITSSFWFLWLYDYITYYILLYLHISYIMYSCVKYVYDIFSIFIIYVFFEIYIYIYIFRGYSVGPTLHKQHWVPMLMVGFQHLAFPKLEKHAQLKSIILLHRTDNRFSASSETHVYLILEIYDYIHIYIYILYIIILLY